MTSLLTHLNNAIILLLMSFLVLLGQTISFLVTGLVKCTRQLSRTVTWLGEKAR